ncbi:MAG: hypothetical protein KY462_01970 [Actinobacteria bacterium]|nr:hypothetical protein [Actinomycetota bacterium]
MAAYNLSGVLDAGAVVDVLVRCQADVVCAVEVPGPFALRRLVRRAGMDVAARAGGRRLGVAVLVGDRVRVISVTRHQLSRASGHPRRSVAQAIVGVGTLRLAAFSTQLGMWPQRRQGHAEDIAAVVAAVSAPVVLGADLNEGPTGLAAQLLAARLTDAFAAVGEGTGETFPNPDPIARNDYLFVDPTLVVRRAWVPRDGVARVASHHRPVIAELVGVLDQRGAVAAPPTGRTGEESAA